MKLTSIGWESPEAERAAFMTYVRRNLYELELWLEHKCVRRVKTTRNQAQQLAGIWCDGGRDETPRVTP